MDVKTLLKQKREAYQTAWLIKIKELETLKLKLYDQEQEKLDMLLEELAILVKSATNNVTLTPDSGL